MGERSSTGGKSKKGRQHVAHKGKCQTQFSRTLRNKEKHWRQSDTPQTIRKAKREKMLAKAGRVNIL